MRLWLNHTLIFLLIFAAPVLAGECGTPGNPPCVGLTPCGAPDAGALVDNYRIAVCKPTSTGAYSTTPDGITAYVRGQLSGELAPAFHNHSTATATRNGYMSATDKTKIDAGLVTTRTEGAIGDGTWHSLESAGFTLDSAKAKFSAIADQITSISTFSVDWAAAANAIAKASAAGINYVLNYGASLVIERPLSIPSNMTFDGGSIAPYEGTFPTEYGLLTTTAQAVNVVIKDVTFLETEKNNNINYSGGSTLSSGIYTGVQVTEGAYWENTNAASGVTVTDCKFFRLLRGVHLLKNSHYTTISGNYMYRVGRPVYFDATPGSTNEGHGPTVIQDNHFSYQYRPTGVGAYAVVRFAANAAFDRLTIEGNRLDYAAGGLLYWVNTLTGMSSDNLYVADNKGSTEGARYGIVRLEGIMGTTPVTVHNNHFYGANMDSDYGVVVGGGAYHWRVTENSLTHIGPTVLKLTAPAMTAFISGNTMNGYNNDGASNGLLSVTTPISIQGFTGGSWITKVVFGVNNLGQADRAQLVAGQIYDLNKISVRYSWEAY